MRARRSFSSALVVAAAFERFVVEVLDRFVVQQRVDRARLAGGLQLVHLAAEFGAPFGHHHGERDVEHQRHQRDPHVAHVELGAQQREHHGHLDQRGDDAVERVRDERLHAARAAFDVARHAAGLALQVKAQAQRVQVTRTPASAMLRVAPFGGLGEHQLAQLGKQAGGKPQRTIRQQQAHGHDQQPLHARSQPGGAAHGGGHGIDQLFQQQRHADVGPLGRHHEAQRQHHPPFVGPQVGKQPLQGGPVGAAGGGLAGRRRGWRGMVKGGMGRSLAHGRVQSGMAVETGSESCIEPPLANVRTASGHNPGLPQATPPASPGTSCQTGRAG